MAWEDFTDEQLSMVLSHLAGRGNLCCSTGLQAAETICQNNRQLEELREFAYDRLGCDPSEAGDYDWWAYYLEKAENVISGIGPQVPMIGPRKKGASDGGDR